MLPISAEVAAQYLDDTMDALYPLMAVTEQMIPAGFHDALRWELCRNGQTLAFVNPARN